MLIRDVCLVSAVIGALAACSGLERSRELGNPAVPAFATATQVCANCHGIDGNSVSPNFPNLAGQREAYLIGQLDAFRSQGRSDPAGFEYMWGLSRHLTDEQIKALAAYYAAQAPHLMVAPGTTSAQGKAIYEGGIAEKHIPACATCHGQRGEGLDGYPRLASQHADYLFKQLKVFQRTDERPEGSVMKTIAHEMTPQQMVDVSLYLQGLSGK